MSPSEYWYSIYGDAWLIMTSWWLTGVTDWLSTKKHDETCHNDRCHGRFCCCDGHTQTHTFTSKQQALVAIIHFHPDFSSYVWNCIVWTVGGLMSLKTLLRGCHVFISYCHSVVYLHYNVTCWLAVCQAQHSHSMCCTNYCHVNVEMC